MIEKKVGNSIIELTQGDITHQVVDIIVNAANSSLLGGGGVDGSIHRAGGKSILDECKKIRSEIGSLPSGKAVITTAGNLNAKYVIHAVGPMWSGGNQREAQLLTTVYRNCLILAEEKLAETIAFPSISTGAYSYPVNKAAGIAMITVANYLKSTKCIKLVKFVLFDIKTFDAYKKAITHIH